MHLGILTTAHCNASCGHCSTSCGPQRSEHLSRDEIIGLMDDAAVLSEGEHIKFSLSGGEVFLDYALLLDVVAHGHHLGAEVTCVTNGYWATSRERALALLAPLKEAGLSRFAVSASSFHQRYVKRQRVERVLAAAREIGLPCIAKYVRIASDPEDAAAIRRWAEGAGADGVQELPLLPHLRRGELLPEREYLRESGLPQGPCPAAIVTVYEDGAAYTCSAPGGDVPLLHLGNVRQDNLGEVRDRFHFGGTQQLLRRHGPIHFARAIQAAGEGGRLRTAYAGECDLCTHIVSDPQLAALAAEAVAAFEREQMEDLLTSLGDSPSATA